MNNLFFLSENRQICYAICYYLWLHPDQAETLNFRAEYLGQDSQQQLSALYSAVTQLIKKYNMSPTIATLEQAYFTVVDKTYEVAYNCPDDVDKEVYNKMQLHRSRLHSLLDNMEQQYSSLGDDFLYEKARELVIEEVTVRKFKQQQLNFVTACGERGSSIQTPDEFRNLIEKNEKTLEMYKYPDEDDEEVYIINDFDSHFAIDVSDKIFPTNCKQLNNYLCGGFHTQSLTGFLTKTGGGKTTLLVTLAADAMMNQQNVCIVNLEMNDFEIYSNMLSSITNTRTYDDVLHHLNHEDYMQMTKNEFDRLNPGIGGLFSRTKNIKNDTCTDIDWIDRKVKKLEKKIAKQYNKPDFRFDIIYIDYLYLMSPKAKMHKNARPDELYRQIVIETHQWAQDNDYAVVTVFQGNRSAEQKLNNNEEITLADAGDSYAAFRDLEYAFSVGRLSDPDNDRDGVIITPLKTRHYDGEWTPFYIPYIRGIRKYDMQLCEDYLTVKLQSNSTTANKKDTTNGKITISELLDAMPECEHIVGGTVVNAMRDSKKVYKANTDNLREEYSIRGWKYCTASDWGQPIEKEQYNVWRQSIMDKIDELYNKKHHPEYKLVMSDNINELFD